MQTNQNMKTSEYKKLLNDYHRLSDRHVLVLETNLSYQDRCKVFHFADLERKSGNELVAIMKNNYKQMIRTKRYRKLKVLYGKYAKPMIRKITKLLPVNSIICNKNIMLLGILQKSNDSNRQKIWNRCHFALTKAEDVWKAIEKCLYADGNEIHFTKRDDHQILGQSSLIGNYYFCY